MLQKKKNIKGHRKKNYQEHLLLNNKNFTGACFLTLFEVLPFIFLSVVEIALKKHTQVKVPLPSKKCSVCIVKVLVQKNYLSKSKRVAYLKVLMSIE